MFAKLKAIFSGYNAQRYWYLPEPPKSIDEAITECRQILENLSKNRELHNLRFIYWILLDKHLNLRKETAKALLTLINDIPTKRLAYIDAQCRETTSLEWSFEWKKAHAEDFIDESMSEDEKTVVLGIVSFHPNGYLREKAIKKLAELGNNRALPFILIRLNDWVPQVRNVARNAIENLIGMNGLEGLALSVPLLKRLEKCRRANHSKFVQGMLNLLSQNKHALMTGLQSKDNDTRRFCFSVSSQSDEFNTDELIDLTKKEKNGHVRAYFLEKLRTRLSEDEIRNLIPAFFSDKHTRVRVAALDLYCQHFLEDAEDILEHQLLSDSRSARETARHYLRKLGKEEFATFYKRNLEDGTLGVIAGLAETGEKQDAKLLEKFLDSKKTRIVRIALRGISGLLGNEASDLLFGFINYERASVSKEVTRHFLVHTPEIPDNMYTVYASTTKTHVKENAMRVLCTLPSWESLPYILEAYVSENPRLKEIGTGMLFRWKKKIVQVYTRPNESQRERIEGAINEFGTRLDGKLIAEIRFNMK